MIDTTASINIERAVLCSIFFDYEIFEELTIKSQDFYFPAHQKIFHVMVALHKNGMPIDEEFLRKRLSTKDVDDSILIEILSSNPITNFMAYQNQIIEDSKFRKLANLSTTIKKVSIEEDIPIAEAIDIVQKEINAIDNDLLSTRNTSDMVEAFKQLMIEASNNNGPIGLKTNMSKLNNMIGAFEPGQLVVIGARPSMGKTSIAVNFANDFLLTGDGVFFDSLEMKGEDIIKRFVACRNLESLSDLQKGVILNRDKYFETLKDLSTNPNFILHDVKGLSFTQIAAKAKKTLRRAQKNGLNIKAWFIDHVGRIRTNPLNKRIEMSDGIKDLVSIAGEFGVTLFLLTQLNRDVQKRKGFRPQLSDIKQTGSLEEDADIVIFPHRDSYYTRADRNQQEPSINKAELIIPKNRNGRTGVIQAMFNGPCNLFTSEDIPIEVVFQSDDGKIEMPIIE